METDADTRALIYDSPNAILVYLGAGIEIPAVLSRDPDQTMDINGRRTTVRCVNADIGGVVVGSSVTLKDSGLVFTVREKMPGLITTVLVLEQQ